MVVRVPLAEYTHANLHAAMPAGALAAATRLTLGKDAGYSALSEAYELVLHPLKYGAAVYTYDVVIHKAVVVNEITLPHKIDDTKIIAVEFMALVDTSKSDGNLLGHIGDSTA